jgi:hypothetical protein
VLDTAGEVVAAADTDEVGRYAIEGLPGGEYTAVASGYPRPPTRCTSPDGRAPSGTTSN